MDAASLPPLRIVLCPYLAFGHLLPYLELAERLALRGHLVSYVSTPRNLARLPPLRPATAPRVDLVALPLPRVDGLPDGAESTNDVRAADRELHWKAFDGLVAPFAEFLAAACADEATRPHWIIADSFHHWAAAVGPVPTPSTSGDGDTTDDERRQNNSLAELDEVLYAETHSSTKLASN